MDPFLDAIDAHLDEQLPTRGECSVCHHHNVMVIDGMCADPNRCVPDELVDEFEAVRGLLMDHAPEGKEREAYMVALGPKGSETYKFIVSDIGPTSLIGFGTMNFSSVSDLLNNTRQLVEFFGSDIDDKVSRMVFEKPDLLQLDLEMEI